MVAILVPESKKILEIFFNSRKYNLEDKKWRGRKYIILNSSRTVMANL